MHLQLHPQRKTAFEHPFRKLRELHPSPDGGDEQLAARPGEAVLRDHPRRVFEIFARTDNELYFVARPEQLVIIHTVARRHPRRREFAVDDAAHPRRYRVEGDRTVRLQQHLEARVEQKSAQLRRLALFHRLAARDFDELQPRIPRQREEIGERVLPAPGFRVLRVAVRATARAPRQPDEETRPSGVRRLALNARKRFANREHSGTPIPSRSRRSSRTRRCAPKSP